ncbi:putative F-box protein At5g42430 [Papaver somniferum]|uniref:putative F-box protein At5g42430 n=1 Tax=Papaver somniferum TaxID=3469 RepID=UPI000E6F9E97|nr:putative F-box protein At5g42430 [Papaver somniferum]
MDKVSHPLVCNESLLCEILSRLPVKSLMRFKCVSKPWLYLIKKDRYFIDLHFTRSNTAPKSISMLVAVFDSEKNKEMSLLSTEIMLPYGGEDEHEGGGGRGVGTIQRKLLGPCSATRHRFLNGLICYIEKDEVKIDRVCVQNPSTGESTPWVSSLIRQQFGEDCSSVVLNANGSATYKISPTLSSCEFGYDPVTKEHKVVGLWGTGKWDMDGKIISEKCVCEVWTVGSNSWRRIDDHPRHDLVKMGFKSTKYANGSIYWLGYSCSNDHCIIEFNVGSEKFREISLPNFIRDDIGVACGTKLIQIDGHLAILALGMSYPSFQNNRIIWVNNTKTSTKMCILYDINNDQDARSTSSASICSNYYWMEGTFLMPPFDPETGSRSIQTIPGTDLFIVRSYKDHDLSFYYYNWKKKSFSSSKFEVHGILELIQDYKVPVSLSELLIYTFRESILPVNPL